MSFIDILLLLIFALEFLLGVFVLLNGYKKTVNRILAFFSFCVAGWGGSVLLVKYTESILAARFAFAFGTLLILTYVLFAAVFPNRKKINFSLYIFAIPALFFLVSSFYGDFLFSDFIIRGGAIIAERGILYPWFVLFSIVYIAVSAYFLTIKYRSSFGKSRLQMNYFLAGLFTFMIGGTFSNIILPALGVQFFNTIGPAFSIFFVVATTYSIVRFRLMDIRLVFKKSFVYASALATLVIIVGGASVFEDLFFSTFIPLWMKNFLIVTFSVLIFEPLNRFYSYIANKYFFTGLYNYQRTTQDFIKSLATLIEIRQIVNLFKSVAVNSIGVDSFAFVLMDPIKKRRKYDISSYIGFDYVAIKKLISDMKFIDIVSGLGGVFPVERNPESGIDYGNFSSVYVSKMQKQRVELIIPFFRKEKLSGFVLLGDKISGDAFTTLDYDFLTTMSNQAAIAIENAMLYQEVQDYSENLEERVDEQTQEIKDLYEMKSNFLTVASHQLRTPTSIIRGMLSMLVEEGLQPEKKDEMIEAAFKSSSALERVIDDILTAAEIDSARFDFEPESVDIIPIIDRIIEELQLKAEKKHLNLVFKRPRTQSVYVMTSKSKIEQAFVNLVDNALNYTAKGGVTVSIKNEIYRGKQHVAFMCTDTGVGMTASDMKKIGEKFFRSKNVFAVHPNGTGLGIFIVRQVVKASKGKLVLESKGLGKGSTFKILLQKGKKSTKNEQKK